MLKLESCFLSDKDNLRIARSKCMSLYSSVVKFEYMLAVKSLHTLEFAEVLAGIQQSF
jgi:hypothetical protein